MSSLWTPEGEHRVPLGGATSPPAGNPTTPTYGRPASADHRPPTEPDRWDEEDEPLTEEEAAARLDELRRQLADAPVEAVIANHCLAVFELAALHLSLQPPQLDQARLAIDALGALVEGLAGRLGAQEPTLKDGLANLRLAFVQIHASQGGPPSS